MASGHLGQICPKTVSRGYRIEFTAKPPTTLRVWWKETPKNLSRRADLERGLQSMLDKQAIREIPVTPETPGFYSPIFLVAKESGGWRPILNLKAFNKFVVPPSFQMETLRTVMDCLGEAAQQRQNTSEHLRDLSLSEKWAISIDLRDAYFNVAVVPEHTRYLRFAYNGRAFEFLVLPFGLSTAPRVFTRIVRVIEAFLKVQGVDMNQYLDDWLMKSQSKSLVERHRDLTLFWVNKLGFLVNEGKSQLTPTQAPAFLGSTLYLLNMLVFPSERRILRATRLAASLLARTAQPAKTWQRFLGHLSSLRELVPMAVVHTRPIQLMLHDQWTQVLDSPYVCIHPNEATLAEWWTSQANLRVGRPFLHQDPTMSIVTDASKEGLGGHLGNWVVSGHWSRAWAKRHINWLELQAVWLTLKHFLPQLQGTAVDVISDNSTTVAYINKVGGTQSPSLCHLALDVWAWCRQHDIFLVASHLSGDKNVLADDLSRGSHRHPTEWTLHNAVTRAIFQCWPTPHVDLFASEKNHKLPVFFSIRLSPSSSGVNALTQNWECLYGYAYPLTALVPRVLRKLRLQPTAPFWPSQPWFRQLTSMLTDMPRAISQRDDLLKNAVTGMRYPKPEAIRLTVWPLSANPSLTAAFQQTLLTRQPEPDESQLAGFMVPVLDTTKGGAWTEVWTPLKHL